MKKFVYGIICFIFSITLSVLCSILVLDFYSLAKSGGLENLALIAFIPMLIIGYIVDLIFICITNILLKKAKSDEVSKSVSNVSSALIVINTVIALISFCILFYVVVYRNKYPE